MRWLTSYALLAAAAEAITLDVTNVASIKSAASAVAYRMMSYYNGNLTGGIPGQSYLEVRNEERAEERASIGSEQWFCLSFLASWKDNRPLAYADSWKGLFPTYPNPLTQIPEKIYWWETGEAFGVLLDYWQLTNDSTYNDVVSTGMLFQVGPNNDFQPPNQTVDLGNDDQAYWAFTAMRAAELGFPNPPADQPQWLALAQAVFNTQAPRWDTSTCAGGLRWQVYSFAQGYNYKNSASNAAFFNLAARLFAYTHNETYGEWAEKSWNWMRSINLIDGDYHVYDGSDDTKNCTDLNHIQWTYTSGMALHGSAAMYNAMSSNATVLSNSTAAQNISSADTWKTRAQGFWDTGSNVFFKNKIMNEVACETNVPINCNTDQLSFKSSYAGFLGAATTLMPELYSQIIPYLAASASAAAAECTGKPGTDSCGSTWLNNGVWDGTTGVGQEMSALGVIQWNLAKQSRIAFTNTTGGTSVGNSAAGTGNGQGPIAPPREITTGDRAGAGILTALIIILTLGTVWYGLSSESISDPTPAVPRKHG